MNFIPDSMQYIALMAACLLLTLPLEAVLGARVYRRPLQAVQAVLVTALIFSVWDVVALRAGLWSYSERFTSGIVLPFGLPLEELIFFIAIPLCGLLTFEAVGRVIARFSPRTERHDHARQGATDA